MNKSKSNNKKVVKVEQEKEVTAVSKTAPTETIPIEIQEKLNSINDKIKAIYDENKKKMLEVENKFNEQLKVQFKKRSELLENSKDFQGFWASVLSQAMIDNFADNDQEVVNYLTNIEVENNINVDKEETSKKITFYFKDNSIFKNKQISKEIITDRDGQSTVKNTKIDYTNNNSTPITTKAGGSNNKNKRKQVDFADQSFILTWLAGDDADMDTMEEFSGLFEDPFSVLVDQDDDEDDEDFSGEEGDEEGDEEQDE